jgi:hypothetical protein
MFLSNRDIQWAIDCQQLVVDPRPETFGVGYDETSIDLHLDDVKEAQIWDVEAFAKEQALAVALNCIWGDSSGVNSVKSTSLIPLMNPPMMQFGSGNSSVGGADR